MKEDPILFFLYFNNTILNGEISFGIVVSLIVIFFLILLSALISGSEVAFFSLNLKNLKILFEEDRQKERSIRSLLRNPNKLLATILIANNFVNVAIIVLSFYVTSQIFNFSNAPVIQFIVQVLVITIILVLLGEITPKVYAKQHAVRFSKNMVVMINILQKIFSPISLVLLSFTNIIDKRMKQKSNITSLHKKDSSKDKDEKSVVSSLSPREIVSELDRYVIGQKAAKRAVAIALRNRWRRQALKGEMKDEVLPKNILMIGPTGVGKTEISRRLSKLAEAPFIKVEATRFTEVGYVGRDVEQIIRDLLEISIAIEKERMRKQVYTKAQQAAEERVLNALVGNKASVATRESFRKRLRNGDLDNNEIEIEVNEAANMPSFEIPGMPGANVGMINISEMLGKNMKKGKKKKMTVKESHEILIAEESDKMIEQDVIIKDAKISTENNGIVFLDEIDKVSARGDRIGGDVSREGVQRDLLPLIEGTTVSTKHGPVKTDHILFIASGAFQLAKPSDLLPELQGRLPIRVELSALTSDDFRRILEEPDNSLIKQYKALLETEKVTLEFSKDGIETIAKLATEINATIENIGARRLHTIIEKVLDEISFTATDRSGEKIIIDKNYVTKNLGELAKDTDLTKFIL